MIHATLIISQEYHMNQPSVFAFIDGKYYGCMIYPRGRDYPKSADYWQQTTSSDSDRGFVVSEVEYSDADMVRIQALQTAIIAMQALIPSQPRWDSEYPVPSVHSFKIRRGKAYEAYCRASDIRKSAVSQYFESIKIYDMAQNKAFNELRKLLLND